MGTGIALLLVLATAPPPSPPSALAAVRLRDSVVVLVGSCGTPDSHGSPVIAGCSGGEPAWELALSRDPAGAWSPARRIGAPAAGAPFTNHGEPWTLELSDEVEGKRAWFQAQPLRTEMKQGSQRLDRAQDGLSHAVIALDDWTFALVEHLPYPSAIAVHLVTAPGPQALEMESSSTVHPTEWPDAAWLAGADAGAGMVVALGRDDRFGMLHALLLHENTATVAPPLPVTADEAAAITWDGTRALVAIGGPHGVKLHALEGVAWSETASAPDEVPSGAPLLAIAGGPGRKDVLVAWREGDDLRVLETSGAGFGKAKILSLAHPAPDAAHAAPPEPDGDREGWRPSPLVLAGLGLAVLMALLAAWIRHRMRG